MTVLSNDTFKIKKGAVAMVRVVSLVLWFANAVLVLGFEGNSCS